MKRGFDHPPGELDFWRKLVKPILLRQPTPFYLFSVGPIEAALRELKRHFASLPTRHWLSFKTQPLRALIQWWQRQGLGVEVVSEFELRAARVEGFPPERILVNGPAKHHWLPRHPLRGLRVNFDSPAEARSLTLLAKKLDWTVGVRFHTRQEFDPESPEFPTQFGMTAEEALPTLRWLQRAGVRLQTAHFHLRTNVAAPKIYERALNEVARVCHAAGFSPRYVDCG